MIISLRTLNWTSHAAGSRFADRKVSYRALKKRSLRLGRQKR
jgi:hypothetical protein